MTELIKIVIEDVLQAIYQPFLFAVVLSFFVTISIYEIGSIKTLVKNWFYLFKGQQTFRRSFFLILYAVMILFKTLYSRSIWTNPTKNVLGVWGLHKYNTEGTLVFTTEVPENLALFIPFTILLLWTYRERIIGEEVRLSRVLWQSTKIVFLFSFTIEFLQLLLRLGTWQLSDLVYNTLGGFIGGLIYWIGYRIKHRK